jgi:hypothetical protein
MGASPSFKNGVLFLVELWTAIPLLFSHISLGRFSVSHADRWRLSNEPCLNLRRSSSCCELGPNHRGSFIARFARVVYSGE